MNEHVPARQAMAMYFGKFEGKLAKEVKGRQGNVCTIASVLSDDYTKAFKKSIKTQSEYEAVVSLAQDRLKWKTVVAKVTGAYCEGRSEKETKRKEAREEKKTKTGKENNKEL